MNYKETIKSLLIGMMVTAAVLCVMELSTRVISWSSGKGFSIPLYDREPYEKEVGDIYQWHPFVGFIHKPDSLFTGGHPNQKEPATLFVDHYGFLAKDNGLSYQKPENEIRIATIGGSTTASLNLPYDDNWPGYLGNLLQKQFPDKKVRIINAGVSGFDTSQNIGNLALRVMPFKPDIVIIYDAYNDLKAVSPPEKFMPDYSHIHTTPYGYYKKPNIFVQLLDKSMTYVRIRNGIRKRKAKEDVTYTISKNSSNSRLSDIPPNEANTFEQHIHSLVSIAQGDGAKVILVSCATLHDPSLNWSNIETFNRSSQFQKDNLGDMLYFTSGLTLDGIFNGVNRYNAILKKIAEEKNTGWVDNAALIPHADEYFVDRIHFSKAGAQRMAENLLPAVLTMMTGPASPN